MLDVRAANGGMRCEAGAGDANAAGALRGAGLGDQRPAGSRAGMAATCGVSRRTSWLNVKGAAGPAYGCTRRIPDGAGTAGGCCAIGLRGAGRHSALVVTPGLAEGFGVWAARIAAPGISDVAGGHADGVNAHLVLRVREGAVAIILGEAVENGAAEEGEFLEANAIAAGEGEVGLDGEAGALLSGGNSFEVKDAEAIMLTKAGEDVVYFLVLQGRGSKLAWSRRLCLGMEAGRYS